MRMPVTIPGLSETFAVSGRTMNTHLSCLYAKFQSTGCVHGSDIKPQKQSIKTTLTTVSQTQCRSCVG